MIIFVLLWLLAMVDAGFIGYREAAGRNALIDKREYYRKALLRGIIFGQTAVMIVGVVVAVILTVSNDPRFLLEEFEKVGRRMLTVFIPYAVILFIAFAVRLMPSVDLRSITSVLIFGPFTLLRPFVVLGGVIYGLYYASSPATFFICLVIISLMLRLESIIRTLRSIAPRLF